MSVHLGMNFFRNVAKKVKRTVSGIDQKANASSQPSRIAANTTADKLDEFVATSDAMGGPGAKACQEYWATFQYHPTAQVDQSLDPYGDLYFSQQLALYEEISGRALDQSINEHSELNVDIHVAAANPYNHPDPATLAGQLATLATVCHVAKAPRGSKVLDMGCGWGLSTETLAYCGFDVDAVDINQKFVDLVNRRAQRLALPIRAVRSSFDDYVPPINTKYSFALFYECLHHAVKPWETIAAIVAMLAPDGKLILASEPVQSLWWKNWGIRMDPVSVYCIRKHGWFESGWSAEFLKDMLARNGFSMSTVAANGIDNAIFVGTLIQPLSALNLTTLASPSQWWVEESYIVSKGRSSLELVIPGGTTGINVVLGNYSPANLDAALQIGSVIENHQLACGKHAIRIAWDGTARAETFTISSALWCPNEVLKNGDMRTLSVHLSAIFFDAK